MPVSLANTPESVYRAYLEGEDQKLRKQAYRDARLQDTFSSIGQLGKAYQSFQGNKADRGILDEMGIPSRRGGVGSQGAPLSSLEKAMAEAMIAQKYQTPEQKAKAAYYNAIAQGKVSPMQMFPGMFGAGGVQPAAPVGQGQGGGQNQMPYDPAVLQQAQAAGAVGWDTDLGTFVDAQGNPVL